MVTHLIKVAVNQTWSEFIASHTVSVNTLLLSDSSNVESNVETFLLQVHFARQLVGLLLRIPR